MLGTVKGNDEACIVQSNSTKAKNLLYFKKRLSFSYSFFREIVRKLCYLQAKTVFSDGRGSLNLKIHPLKGYTFYFIHVSTASVVKCSSWASLLSDNPVAGYGRTGRDLLHAELTLWTTCNMIFMYQNSGGARKGACPSLFLDQTDARRAKIIFFWRPAFPLPQPPSPRYLKVWIQYYRIRVYANREAKY